MSDFITSAINEKRPVKIITTNGFQMRGRIIEVDNESVTFINDGCKMVVFKHAISTISN